MAAAELATHGHLPEHVIDTLSGVDPDLSRAVVRLAQPEVGKQPHPPAELNRPLAGLCAYQSEAIFFQVVFEKSVEISVVLNQCNFLHAFMTMPVQRYN